MKKRDYSSIILILLTIIFVSLCIVVVNIRNNNLFSFRQTTKGSITSTASSNSSSDRETESQSEKNTIVINNNTTSIEPSVCTDDTTSHQAGPTDETTESTTPVIVLDPTTTSETTTAKVTEPVTETTSAAELPTATTPETPTTTPQATAPVIPENYDFSKPVPVSAPVDDNYFLDALFLGDSLTDGLKLYSGLKTAKFYSMQALSTSTAFTTPAVTIGEDKLSIIDAMKVTSFNKVYIMLGINEVGYPSTSSFVKKYEQIIDSIREVNPNATIYVQLILPITETRSATHKYIKNASISKFNTDLIALAARKQVYYLNVGEPLSDPSGALLEEVSADGIHLKSNYYKVWLEYLKNHVIT